MEITVNSEDVLNILTKEQTSNEFQESKEKLEEMINGDDNLESLFNAQKEEYIRKGNIIKETIESIIANSIPMKGSDFFNYINLLRNEFEESRNFDICIPDIGEDLIITAKFLKTWDNIVNNIITKCDDINGDNMWIAENSPITGKSIWNNKNIKDFDSLCEVMEGEMYSYVGCSSINDELYIRQTIIQELLK